MKKSNIKIISSLLCCIPVSGFAETDYISVPYEEWKVLDDAYTKNNQPAEYFKKIINIEREKENPRKDYEKFGGMYDIISFFYPDLYDQYVKDNGLVYNEKFDLETVKEVLKGLLKLDISLDEQGWFSNMKSIGESLGFSSDRKAYKANPENYKGMIGDVAEILRITLTGRKNSPNLYYVMQILGKEECDRRIDKVLNS